MTYIDHRWSGAPAAVAVALAILGHPAYAADGAQQDARVAAWGPVRLDTVAGRAVMFALVRATEAIPTPAEVFEEPGTLAEAATGVFMDGRRIVDGVTFLSLFTPAEVAAMRAADPRLDYGAIKVASQNYCNLDSQDLVGMLTLATARGALAPGRAAQIIAGTPAP